MELTKEEKKIVDEQCRLCRYWSRDAGCADGLNAPHPVSDCYEFQHVLTGQEAKMKPLSGSEIRKLVARANVRGAMLEGKMKPLTPADIGKIISKTSVQVATLDDGFSTQRTIPDIMAAIKLAYEQGYSQGAEDADFAAQTQKALASTGKQITWEELRASMGDQK